MAKNSLMQQLRSLYPAFIDGYGHWRIDYRFEGSDKELSDYRKGLIKDIVYLCTETSLTNRETKEYIKTPYISYAALLVKMRSKDSTYNNVSQAAFNKRITDCISKIEKALGKSALTDIRYYPDKNIKYIEENIMNTYATFNDISKLRENLMFNVDNKSIMVSFDDTYGDFCTLFKSALELTKKKIEAEAARFNSNQDVVGYFNYLLSGMKTDDKKVLRDREYLIDILSGNEIKYQYGEDDMAIYPFGKDDDYASDIAENTDDSIEESIEATIEDDDIIE